MKSWPKKVTVYVHSSKEAMWELGESIGLSEEALGLFKYACCEVALSVEVQENGKARILKVLS